MIQLCRQSSWSVAEFKLLVPPDLMEPSGKRKSEQQMGEGSGLTMREGYSANEKKKKESTWLLCAGVNSWLRR